MKKHNYSTKKRINILKNISVIIFILLLSSCDPTYVVEITNKKTEKITVIAERTIYFNPPESNKVKYLENNLVEFHLKPNESLQCDCIIGGINNNKLPFSKLKAYTKNDTITANDRQEISNLLEKNFLGFYNNPYNIVIKQ